MGVFDYFVERKIQEAIKDGLFNHLEGFGKPLNNEDYFNAPAEERIAFHILKNAGIVPEEVAIRKSIYQIMIDIKKTIDPNEISALEKKKAMLEDLLFVLSEHKKLR
jgi:hypothetical protein